MTKPPRILIAEDEAIQALDLSEFLKDAGYEIVGTVDSGGDAVEMAEHNRPDLVLMDVKLTGDMDGIDAAARIRSRYDIPILYLTAHADAGILERAKITEPYAYLIKPWSGKELLSSIEMALYKSLMEKRLRESEERLHSTLSSLDDLVLVLDSQGVLVDYHLPAASPDVHFAGIDCRGKHISEALPAHVNAILEEAVGKVASTELVQQFDYPLGREETEHWFSAKVSIRRDAAGGFAGVTMVSRDITDRKRTESALRTNTETVNALLNATDEFVGMVDAGGTFCLVNQALAEVFHKEIDEMCGMSIFHILPQDVAAGRKEWLDTVIKTGQPVRFEDEQFDGVFDNIYYPVRDLNGEVSRVAFFVRNITEIRRAERELRRNKELVEALLDATTDMAGLLDLDGILLALNKPFAASFGKTMRELVGKSLFDQWPAEVARVRREVFDDAIRSKETRRIELKRHGRIFDSTVYPVLSESGTVEAAAVFARDVTAQKKASEELERSRDELEQRVVQRTAELARSNELLRIEIEERKKAEKAAREGWSYLRTIFETAPDSIYIKDKSLRYTLINPSFEKLLELPSTGILGKTDHELFGQEAGLHLQEVDYRVLRGETIEEEHTRLVKGNPTTFLDIKAPMRNISGDIIAVCGISRNITERKETQTFTPFTADEYPSDAMRETLALARQAAETDSIVMLTGESGCGKDFLARYIHDRSARAGGSFYSINCAAIPRELAESELFGHESGAFTGASRRKRGLLELAEGGTLVLNEIGELDLPLQAKLLSFLDTFSFTRVGGEKSLTVNARLIGATNRDLKKEVEARRFRADLYYRLNVFTIGVPPLRERIDDIPILVYQILTQLAKEMHLPILPSIPPSVVDELSQYPWPGNVREFRNVIERAVILSKGPRLKLDFLGLAEPQEPSASWTIKFPPRPSLTDVVRNVRRELVEEALSRAGGNKQEASRLLGISRYTLRRQMKGLGLTVPK